jgi:DNA methylase
MTPRNVVLEGDAIAVLKTLADSSVESCITSPPYFQARHYHAGEHELGQEQHVDAWVESLRVVTREIARVLVPTGSLWLNVGDLYSRHTSLGAPPKSLLLGPERLASIRHEGERRVALGEFGGGGGGWAAVWGLLAGCWRSWDAGRMCFEQC